MPCQGPDADEYLIPELHRATRAACDVFKVLRNDFPELWPKVEKSLKPQTLEWLKQHDRADEKRRKAEREDSERAAIRRRAMAKLTKTERDSLNLRGA